MQKNVSENAKIGLLMIQDWIKWLQNVMEVYQGEAKVIFYYAGHGIPDEQNKNGYLLPVDGYGSDDLFKILGSMPSRSVTVFLDKCHISYITFTTA